MKMRKLHNSPELARYVLSYSREARLLWVNKVNFRHRIRSMVYRGQCLEHYSRGLTILAVVAFQELPVLRLLRLLPLMSPHQALQSRGIGRCPPRAEKMPDVLQAIRPYGKIDLAVQGAMHIDQTLADACHISSIPFGECCYRSWFIAPLMINRGVRVSLNLRHKVLPHAALLVDRICPQGDRSEEHTSELQSLRHLVCRLLLE